MGSSSTIILPGERHFVAYRTGVRGGLLADIGQNWLQFLSSQDGQSGFAVIETDNPAGLLAEVTEFVTWNEFEIVPVIDIVEGVTLAAGGVEFRESI